MAMDITQTQSTQTSQRTVASPQLVAANHVLALSSVELQELIYQEMSENPAMELEEAQLCPRCGCPLQGPTCQVCLQSQQADAQRTRDLDDYGDGSGWNQMLRTADDDEFDPTTRVAATMSLAEHLTLSLQAQFPARDAQLIEYLVGNLDEDGRLRCTTDEVTELFNVSERLVERIIRALQSMDPVGVGARNLRECLLIQLDYIESQGIEQMYRSRGHRPLSERAERTQIRADRLGAGDDDGDDPRGRQLSSSATSIRSPAVGTWKGI